MRNTTACRRHHAPQPAQGALLIPRRFIEIGNPGGLRFFEKLFDHRLAGAAELVDAALDGRCSQFEPQPAGEKLLDLCP
jgi:hypothetical protein